MLKNITLPTSWMKQAQQSKEAVFALSLAKEEPSRKSTKCVALEAVIFHMPTVQRASNTRSAALNAHEPTCQYSLAVLGAQWEKRGSVVGVRCILAVRSWHTIHQGLVPSGTDESLSCYTVSLSEIGTWKNITKLGLVCWCKFNFWTTNLIWRGWPLLKLRFSSLSHA